MIRSLLPRWLAWSCYVVALSTSLPAQETVYTPNAAFHIPFNVDHGDVGSDRVCLFYSADSGKTWKLYQQLAGDAARFTFRAPTDGEYWFTVGLRGHDNESDKEPELRVVVDRQQPIIELNVEQVTAGRIMTTWRVSDAHLNRDSPSLEFLSAEDQWQAVPVTPSSNAAAGDVMQGVAEWKSPDLPELTVRMKVLDRAGNLAVVERRFAPSLSAAAPAQTNLLETGPSLAAQSRGTDNRAPPTSQDQGWISMTNAPHSAGAAPLPSSHNRARSGHRPDHSGGDVRLSRSRRFMLEYAVYDATQGIHRIEVWHTQDRGRSWKHLGDDDDRQSPYLVEVTEDGTFGFRLVVQATAGFLAQPPISGDLPDVWVTVDSLAPRVRMTNAGLESEPGSGPAWGTLRLTWESSDENPAEYPVTLLFSDRPDGPWRKLADGQPGSGAYDWRPDQSIPAKFYVRVEARDRVGNVSGHTWSELIQSNHVPPQAQIQDVRPAKNGSLFDAPELR